MIAELNRRIAELSQAIRAYPTPIARCDEQLPALIEERSRLLASLERLESAPRCGPDTQWTNDGGMNAA